MGFSLQRGEKLREGSRYPDRKPQGESFISETSRKGAYEESKGRFLPAPYLPNETYSFSVRLQKHAYKQ